MNQTIPLIKQAKPMVNNVKSMVKLARAFGSETTSVQAINSNAIKRKTLITTATKSKKEVSDNNYPNFFI